MLSLVAVYTFEGGFLLSSLYLCSSRILEVVTTLTIANKTALSHLYKLGAFEILLWKLLDGDVVDWDKTRIVKFLARCHLLQVFFSSGPTRYLFPLGVKYKNLEILFLRLDVS